MHSTAARLSVRLAVGLSVIATVAVDGSAAGATAKRERPDLEHVLAELARVAESYADAALGFTCTEDVRCTRARHTRDYRFEYLYRFTEDGLDDVRRRSAETVEPSGLDDPVTVDDTELPTLLLRPYSWVFVFGHERHRSYRYAFEGWSRVLEIEVIRIHFEPRRSGDRSVDKWIGVADVDPDSFQIVRVEAIRASERATRRPYRTTYRTEFGIVRNGMRFPSLVEIERRFPPLELTQTYRDYRFFEVRTEQDLGLPDR